MFFSKLPAPLRMMEEEYNLVSCDCGCSLIAISHDEEYQHVFLSLFERGKHRDNRLRWKERFRWAWNLICTGKPYADELVLTKQDALNLGEDLISRAEHFQ